MIDLAVFDLDGTLVDSPTAIVETFTAAFAALGVEGPTSGAIRATIGLPLGRSFATLLGCADDAPIVAEGVRRYQAAFREIIVPRATRLLFPGVADGLAELRADGCVLAIATSKFHASADLLLRGAGIRDLFTVLLGADDVARPKPDPEMGLAVLRAAGVPAARAVMVGDTTHDVRMASAARMRSIAVTYGVHDRDELLTAGPTWIADSFPGVLAWIRAGEARRAA